MVLSDYHVCATNPYKLQTRENCETNKWVHYYLIVFELGRRCGEEKNSQRVGEIFWNFQFFYHLVAKVCLGPGAKSLVWPWRTTVYHRELRDMMLHSLIAILYHWNILLGLESWRWYEQILFVLVNMLLFVRIRITQEKFQYHWVEIYMLFVG